MTKKKYRVHHIENKGEDIYNKIEQFLNDLEREGISIIPNVKKGSLPIIYGVTAKVNYLMIV
jgi:hypothetical protein